MVAIQDYLNRSTKMTEGDIIRTQIAAARIVEYATVASVEDETHVSVELWYLDGNGEKVVLTGVELIRFGTSDVSISLVPKKGDILLLIGSKKYVDELTTVNKEAARCTSGSAYDLCTYKAVQLYTPLSSSAPVSIKIDSSSEPAISVNVSGGVSLTTSGSVLINNHLKVKP